MLKENQPLWAIRALVRFCFEWLYTQALGFVMTALLSYIPYVVPRAPVHTSQRIARILEFSLCSSHSKGQVFLPLLSIYFLVLSQSLSFRDPLCCPFVFLCSYPPGLFSSILRPPYQTFLCISFGILPLSAEGLPQMGILVIFLPSWESPSISFL